MMNFLDGRVLGENQAITTAQFGNITHQDHSTDHVGGPCATLQNRNRPHQQRDVVLLVELLHDRLAALEGCACSIVGEPQFRQALSNRVRAYSDAMQR